jgi:hypothetical protein
MFIFFKDESFEQKKLDSCSLRKVYHLLFLSHFGQGTICFIQHRDELGRNMSNTNNHTHHPLLFISHWFRSIKIHTKIQLLVHIACNYRKKIEKQIDVESLLKQDSPKPYRTWSFWFFSFDSFTSMSPILRPRLPSMGDASNNSLEEQ